ncbi:MAG TPA: hypothetical protein VEK08_06825 [Planctomycetota bacterium]|nr:hypothetical protein [Planctomycetota bacterium]
MSEAQYVLFKDGAPKDWARAADALCQSGAGLSRGDATKACRFGQGLIPLPLTPERATAIAGVLCAAGFAAMTIPYSKLLIAPEPYHTQAGRLDESGFHIQVDAHGKLRTLPWETIRAVNVSFVRPGGVRLALPKELPVLPPEPANDNELADSPAMLDGIITELGITMASVAVGVAVGPRAAGLGRLAARQMMGVDSADAAPPLRAESQPSDPEVWLEVFCLEPLFRLRIRQRAFNYDYLGAKRTPNTRGNFKLLAADVMKFASGAARLHHAGAAGNGTNIDNERFLMDEPAHELSLTALLTREALIGLPR